MDERSIIPSGRVPFARFPMWLSFDPLANLAQLRPEGLSELKALASDALDCFERFPADFSAEPLRELYAIAARGIGAGAVVGAPAVDTALVSLCDLLDYLSTSKRWDHEAVAVHVRTLQLLVLGAGKDMDEATADAIVSGLKKVSAIYAQGAICGKNWSG